LVCIKSIHNPDLVLDLLAAQRGRAGWGRDLGKRACKLLCGFNQRRARKRPLFGFAPEARSLLNQPGFGTVTRQQFRVVLRNLAELAFESFCDAAMQGASRLA
jgi:hypothetical protein